VQDSSEWVTRVNSRLEQFMTDRESILRAVSPDLEPFIEFSRQFLSGGKRFRARCALLGYATLHDAVPDHVIDVASALEIFHAAALVHDDIMDKSDTRRGAPSAHRRFETLHQSSGWSGTSDDFGTSSALLFGDLLLAFSDELYSNGIAAEANRIAVRASRIEFDRMRIDVTAGQYLDIVEERAWSAIDKLDALSRAQRVVVFKSAKYSIEAPLVIGAALGGASAVQLDDLRAIGLPLGIAFQLRDDLLGVFGDPAVTGKPAGDDLREGKRTVLIALAQQQLPGTAIRLMDELLGDPELDAAQIGMLQQTLVNSGAVDALEHMIDEQVGKAHAVIDAAELAPSAQHALRELAEVVSRRSS
jgi:geranylgeranyl diphosphate synthase type I